MTQNRVKKFLRETEMKHTDFARHCQISITMLYCFLRNDRNISKATDARINGFIDDYIARVKEV